VGMGRYVSNISISLSSIVSQVQKAVCPWYNLQFHGHTAFCTWLTIEDIDMDILETYLPSPTCFAHNRATPAPHPYMSEPLYPY